MFIVSAIKRQLHRDIVADPVLHGMVLNLYLNGEQYPHRVNDYFPLAAVEDHALEQRMRLHMREEDKHIALYIKAIRTLEQPVLELPREDIYNSVILRHTRASFALRGSDDRDARTLKLAHFLGHLHFLEKRIAHSLEYHLEACARAQSPYPAKAVGAVLADEYGHVLYTQQAVNDLLPARAARDLLAMHRQAEASANREFSSRELSRLVRGHAERFRPARRVFYRCCTSFMQRSAPHG